MLLFRIPKLLLVVLLTLAAYHSNAQMHDKDICTEPPASFAYPVSPSAQKTISLTGPPMNVNVPDCVQVFKLDLAPHLSKFVLIEFRIPVFPKDASYNPLLIGKLNSPPGIDTITDDNNKLNIPEASDLAAFYGRKDYHYIELAPEKTKAGGNFYLTLYKYFDKDNDYYALSVSYDIIVRESNGYICPQNCKSDLKQGSCDPMSGRCNCKQGFSDSDCSIKLTLIKLQPASNNQSVAAGAWGYYYLPIEDFGKEFELKFTENSVSVTVTYDFIDSNSNLLPSAIRTARSVDLTASTNTLGLSLYQNSQVRYNGKNLVLGFFNNDKTNNATIFYEIKDIPSNSSILIIIISILSFLIILTTMISIVKLRNMRLMRVQILRHQANNAPVVCEFLTIEEINKYFPKKAYSKLKSSFQNTCSICLDDFQPDTMCRKLYCDHVFHHACIEEWLKKHDKCPNCNMLMSLEAIKAAEKTKAESGDSPVFPQAKSSQPNSQPQSPNNQPNSQPQSPNNLPNSQPQPLSINPSVVQLQAQGPIELMSPNRNDGTYESIRQARVNNSRRGPSGSSNVEGPIIET